MARLWRDNELKPHRSGTFKVSKDPAFAQKVADVVGLYLDPPGGAVVLSFDEKTQIQALDRTQPLLPIDFGLTEKLGSLLPYEWFRVVVPVLDLGAYVGFERLDAFVDASAGDLVGEVTEPAFDLVDPR